MFQLFKKCISPLIVTSTLGYVSYKYIQSRNCVKNKTVIVESIEDWQLMETDCLTTLKVSKVIGLDCEWVTVKEKRKPLSLLQIGTSTGFSILIRLSKVPIWSIPSSITQILVDEAIIKVGVGIYEDVIKLYHDYGIEVQNFIDLRYISQNLEEMEGKNLSLQNIGFVILGQTMCKSDSLRCSDWDTSSLSEEQINYAADDVVIAAKIYIELKKRNSNMFFGASRTFISEVETFKDLPFKQKHKGLKNDTSTGKKRMPKNRYSKPRQKPMYDNCQLVAPDGELLCSCDKGKAQWYIFKGLGNQIKEDPFTVQLNFEPSGRPTLDNVFYTKEKTNQCVVCGKTENFHRKLVVPSEYRKFFPDLMKKNLSHDVLLLCEHCHKISNISDQQMREELAKLCDAPLGCRKNVKYKFDPELARIKSAAIALKKSGDKIPELRSAELKSRITSFYGVSTCTEELIEQAFNISASSPNDSFVPHGQKVYEYFCKNGGLIQFEKMWRKHFLDTMHPKYLPLMWSVEHNHKRLALQVINHERDVDFDESILGLSSELLSDIHPMQL